MTQIKHLVAISVTAVVASCQFGVLPSIKGKYVATFYAYFLPLLICHWIYWLYLWPFVLSPLRALPTVPNAHWLLGQGKKIAAEPTGHPMREWNNTVPNDGLMVYHSWFNAERLLVTGPKALSEVLVTKAYDFHKPWQVRRGIARIVGEGILLKEGDEHKRQRKHLSPAFAFRHVKDLYPQFWAKSIELVERIAVDVKNRGPEWEKDRDVFEFGEYTSRATLDIIGTTGMGHDFGSIQNPDNALAQHYKAVFKPPKWQRYFQLLTLFIPVWIVHRLPLKRNKLVHDARQYIRDLCQDLINQKRVAIAEKRPGYDILSVALESGGFDDEDLINQLMTFLIAGHETTSTALIWAIYQLCKKPEYQERLRKEVHDHLPSPRTEAGKTIDSTQIDSLPFLTAVMNESLRLWAPVTLTMRVSAKDTVVQGTKVPKGTQVIMSPSATNTSYELWGDDAMEFKPERWMQSNSPAESNFAMLTFLHGPRSCIGEKFSRSEFACLLAACVGRFEWELENPNLDPRIGGMVTARPMDGLWVKVKEQEW